MGSETARAAPASREGDPRIDQLGSAIDRENTKEARAAQAVIGIDVESTGALAIVARDGALIAVHDMPTLYDGPQGRQTVNCPLLAEIVAKSDTTLAFIEYVGARPKEGAVGAFAFGRARGAVEGVCAALAACRTRVLT